MKKINAGLIGAGSSACNIHGRLLTERKDRFNITAFYDIDREKLKTAGERFNAETFDCLEDFLKKEDIELVIVATRPHSTHFPLAMRSMQAGKNVVVEKPMCITADEARLMVNAAKENKVFLFPFQNYRWNLGFMCFKDAIDKKAVGELRYIEAKRHVKGENKGDLYEFMPHMLDAVLALMNFDMPVEITAVLENPDETWDKHGFMHANMRFSNGVMVTLSQLPDETAKTVSFYWYAAGTEGSFWQDNVYNKYDLIGKNSRRTGKAGSFIPDIIETRLIGEQEMKDDFTVSFYDDTYKVLAAGAEQAIKPEQVWTQIYLIEKIIESARTRKAIKTNWEGRNEHNNS